MAPVRDEPIILAATTSASDVARSAAIIFIHGFSDDAFGIEGVASQFRNAGKLPYMQWVIPNAMENMDAMERAWYVPTRLTSFPSQRPELDDPEDEDGILLSRKYIVSLIDDLVQQGVPANRIVLAGFSQGCAMTLVTGLTSKYCGKLGGLAGVCGYMPLADKIGELRKENDLESNIGEVPIFLARGSKDMLVPKRYFRICQEKLSELGVKGDLVEAHEYEKMAHALQPEVLRDLCGWLEKVIPPLEDN